MSVINYKKIAICTLKKKLMEFGYLFNENDSTANVIAFYKCVNTYNYGIKIQKSVYGKQIWAYIHAPTGKDRYLSQLSNNLNREYEYANEEELVKALTDILNDFIQYGIKWLDNQIVEEFDAGNLYKEIIDASLEDYGYKRLSMATDLFKAGQVVYGNGVAKIYFSHGLNIAFCECGIRDKSGFKRINEIAKECGMESILPDIVFRNESEYRKLLSTYLQVLKDCYFMVIT